MKKLITIILCITLSYASIQKSEAAILAAVAPKTTINTGGRIALYVFGGTALVAGAITGGIGFADSSYDSSIDPLAYFGIGLVVLGVALDVKTDAEALKKKSFIHYAKINGYSKKQIKLIEDDLRHLNSIEEFALKVEIDPKNKKQSIKEIKAALKNKTHVQISSAFASVLVAMSGK